MPRRKILPGYFEREDAIHKLFIYIFALCSLTFLIQPLFCEKEFYFSSIILYFIVVIYLITNPRRITAFNLTSVLEISIALLPICYLVSLGYGLHKRYAAQETIKQTTYFFTFLTTLLLLRKKSDLRILLNTIYLGGIAVALIGLCAFLDIIHYAGDTSDDFMRSIFTNHNTFGILMLTIFLLGLGLGRLYRGVTGIPYLIGNSIVLFGIYLSFSRAVWCLLPLGIFVLVSLGDRKERVALIWNAAASLAGIFLVQRQLDWAVYNGETDKALLYLSAGVLTPILLSFLFYYTRCNVKIKRSIGLVFVLLSIVVISLALVRYRNGKDFLASCLSQHFLTRVQSIGFDQRSVQQRLVFYSDALEIIRDYPITGGGGGVWKVLYKTYQESNYFSQEIHSRILQIASDTGVLGSSSYLLLISALIFSVIKSLRRYSSGVERMTLAVVSSMLIVLLIHSQFDFDMSIPFVAVYFWILVGIVVYYHRSAMEDRPDRRKTFVKSLSVIILLGLNFMFVSLFYTGTLFEKRALESLSRSKFDEAERNFARATLFYPINEIYPVKLAYIKLRTYKKCRDPVIRDEIEHLLYKSLNLGIIDSRTLSVTAYIYFEINEFEKALQAIDTLVKTRPLMSETYLEISRLLIHVAQERIRTDKYESAMKVCEHLQKISNQASSEGVYLDPETLENIRQSKILMDKSKSYNSLTFKSIWSK